MSKIVFIIDDLHVSGAQVHLSRMVEGLNKLAISAGIICLGPVDPNVSKYISPDNLFRVDMSSVRNRSYLLNFFKLIRLIKTLNPMIVHTYLNTANVMGVCAAKMARVPHIVSSRRDMGHFRTGRIAKIEVFLNRFVEKVVCVSNAVKEKVIAKERLLPQKAVVLYSGVDSSFFSPTNEKNPTTGKVKIGMVATMNREVKGHRHFLSAAEKVLLTTQNVSFVLIGDGPLRESLVSYINSKNIGAFFDFRGASADVRRELANLDVFVMPSLSEGFSNAILEAMAMELPVVANALEGNLEIIEDGKTGFLTKPADAEDIAQKILALVANPDLRSAMGRAGRERILENFTVEHMVERYRKFYEELMRDQKKYRKVKC